MYLGDVKLDLREIIYQALASESVDDGQINLWIKTRTITMRIGNHVFGV